MQKVLILGSTGSIGTQAIEIIRENRDAFEIVGLSAFSNSDLLKEQAAEFNVEQKNVALIKNDGENAALNLVKNVECDVILNGIAGSAGLSSTLEAINQFKLNGTKLALANKESLVAGGSIVQSLLQEPMTDRAIIPVDSEHSAIWQTLRHENRTDLHKIILTASGGAFRKYSQAELENVTIEQALKHPNWSMGKVVTINSATLMNKALELIEAVWLFSVQPENVQVVVHPQSAIHSGVQFRDGALLFEASVPDMKLPISLGINCGERLKTLQAPEVDFNTEFSWDFELVDNSKFPAIGLAVAAFKESPLHPAIMNAANEEAVDKFLNGEIKFTHIIPTVEKVLEKFNVKNFVSDGSGFSNISFETVLEVENWARNIAKNEV